MKAVILAAGEGTRLRPLTKDKPKPLVKIGDSPILEYTLDQLPDRVTEVIVVISYKGEKIKDYFGIKHKKRKIKYISQEELKGTADALFSCKEELKDEKKFLVINGDDLYKKEDLEKLVKKDLAILVKETNQPEKFGIVTTTDENTVKQIKEKPQNLKKGLANIGAYILGPQIFKYKPVKITEKEYGLPQTIEKMAEDYKIEITKADFWVPIGYPKDVNRAEKIIE